MDEVATSAGARPHRSTAESLRFLWRNMGGRRRGHFVMALGVMLLGTLAELMTIGAVLPFLAILSNPEGSAANPALAWLRVISDAGDPAQLALVAAGLLIAAAVSAALIRLLLTWVSLGFVMVLSHEIGTQVFARMLRQPYGYYVTRNSSEVLSGIDKVQVVIWGVLMPAMQGITAAVMALAIIGLLFVIDPVTTMIAAATLGFAYLAVGVVFRARLHRNSEQLGQAATERVQAIQEGLGGIRDIILEQSQEVFERKFKRMDYAYRRAQTVNNFILLAPRFVVEGTGIVLIALLAVYLSRQPGGILAAMPVLGALAVGAQRLLPLLQQTYLGWSSLAGNRELLLDVTDLMRAPVVTSQPRDRSCPVPPFRRDIALDEVGFRYDERAYALRGVNLTIAKGARVGFVGETGSGKSTLLDLIMGLLEPSSGRILIDGVPLSDATRSLWQAQIAHVPQTIFLSDSSIAANIAFAEAGESIDMGLVKRAAATAHIHDFIAGLPDAYDTFVGERGVRLSGGQRQRIGIARALYKQAPVLVFDEATSALDDATERAIMRSIGELGPEVTLLMIAHRTSTLANCDTIVRLSAGSIASVGGYRDMFGDQATRPAEAV